MILKAHDMFAKIIKDPPKYSQNTDKVHNILKTIDEEAMERKEAEIYKSLICS